MPAPLDQRPARERRIWRLAYLLTGDPGAAARLVVEVLDAQSRPERVDPARLDRLVVLRAREWAKRRAVHADLPASAPAGHDPVSPQAATALGAALTLPRQCLEAWVFARVDGLDELAMSRAMDCSRTAAARYLAQADELMCARLGDATAQALAALRAEAGSAEPGPMIHALREERRRQRRVRAALVILMCLAIVLSVMLAWVRGWTP